MDNKYGFGSKNVLNMTWQITNYFINLNTTCFLTKTKLIWPKTEDSDIVKYYDDDDHWEIHEILQKSFI